MEPTHIDFETRSAVDLPAAGLHIYATHPSTDIHCMAYSVADHVGLIWKPQLPDAIRKHVINGGEIVAHNAVFELAIWNNVCVPRYGWPVLKPEQCRCTMAQAYAMGLPASLEHAAAAVGIDAQKDMQGSRIMLQLSKPKADGSFWQFADDPEKFERLYEYCKQDVRVEMELDSRLMRLSPSEREVWLMDQRINNYGIYVDLQSIDKAIAIVDAEKKRLDKEMLMVTGGVVGKCSEVQLLVKWIRSQGVELKGLAKADVLDALNTDDVPPSVRKALKLRQEAARSSTAKLTAMKERASVDGRVRGCFQYHGAATGRWAHRGIQPGNLPRPRKDTKQHHIDDVIAHLADRDYIDINYGPVMDAMADSIRAMICAPPGRKLIAMDFSAVEARALAWLAGQESILDIFRTHGLIYEHAAAGIYNKPIEAVTKDERQIGKVAVLALGYGGGVGAFQSMARVYGVHVSDERADSIKTAWRDANPAIVRYWKDLEGAAINAVDYGCLTKAGPEGRQVEFRLSGSFLWCKLPSGRVLCYPYPVIKEVETPWGSKNNALTYMAINGVTRKWEETNTYGGALAENVTQALSACLLRDAMVRTEKSGYAITMHVHDEIVIEVDEDDATALHTLEEVMSHVPDWAKGLPLGAEGWEGKRYRK